MFSSTVATSTWTVLEEAAVMGETLGEGGQARHRERGSGVEDRQRPTGLLAPLVPTPVSHCTLLRLLSAITSPPSPTEDEAHVGDGQHPCTQSRCRGGGAGLETLCLSVGSSPCCPSATVAKLMCCLPQAMTVQGQLQCAAGMGTACTLLLVWHDQAAAATAHGLVWSSKQL